MFLNERHRLGERQGKRLKKQSLSSNDLVVGNMCGSRKWNYPALFGALLYATTSGSLILFNKKLLTTYHFPSFLVISCAQMLTTILTIVLLQPFFHLATSLSITHQSLQQIFPLPLFFLLNVISGIGAIKSVNVPMFTVLRRLGLLFTMMAEYLIVGILPDQFSIVALIVMVMGAAVAATDDLSFDMIGYILIFFNNIATAGNGVFIKKKVSLQKMSKCDIVYLNTIFSLPLACILLICLDDMCEIQKFFKTADTSFFFTFFLSCIFSTMLNFSYVFIVHSTSALTTCIIGCLKNIIVTYLGMVVSLDYKYSTLNFIGIHISILGAIIYINRALFKKDPTTTTTSTSTQRQIV
ncbi:hypothetical protein SNEBB_009744 [Seison nebaliae]|nr:hypothetical protein SNEBB_009744 [Seison nebaliae]